MLEWTIPRWEYKVKLVAGESDKAWWSCPSTASGCIAEIIHWHPGQCINKQDLFLFWFPEPLTCLCDPLRLEARLCSHLTFPFQCSSSLLLLPGILCMQGPPRRTWSTLMNPSASRSWSGGGEHYHICTEVREGSDWSRPSYVTQGLSQHFLLEPNSMLSFLWMEGL